MTDTLYNTQAQEYLKNEKIQIFIRLSFIFIAAVSIYFFNIYESSKYDFGFIMLAPTFVFVLNLVYYTILKHYPYKFQTQRILFALLLDISLTVYVMYLVDALSAYYAGALLWFSVAYGMRYSKLVAYIAYVTVLITWSVLMVTSDFWIQYKNFAIGWLLAYIVLPLYYFKLVDKLHRNLESLHNYATESTHKALHDQLTGVSNRTLFEEELTDYIDAFEKKNEKFALFFIDLDFFKEINDKYGHDTGDKVLIETSKRLQSVIEHTYRLGGDEFVCILSYSVESDLKDKANNLMKALRMPCKEKEIMLSASIGIARFPIDAQSRFDIKKHADLAMYAAKQSGKNRYCFYSEVA